MNDQALIPINIDILRSGEPSIEMMGSQSRALSLWAFRSSDFCMQKPMQNVELVTVHFVTSGQVAFRNVDDDATGTPKTAVMTNLATLRDFRSSKMFSSFGCAFACETLIALNQALTGTDHPALPAFAVSAEITTTALKALFCTMREVHRRSLALDWSDDLVFGLIEEILGYQLLSAWPRDVEVPDPDRGQARVDRLDRAKQFIEANLATRITLSDIAAASGLSVRTLQDSFRRSENLTPVAYLLHRRLQRVHADLMARRHRELSIREIALQWGFVHAGDFGRRYRAAFGCTPTETRRQAG